MSLQALAHFTVIAFFIGNSYISAHPNEINLKSLSAWGFPQISGSDEITLNPLSNHGFLARGLQAAQERAMNLAATMEVKRAFELSPNDRELGFQLGMVESFERIHAVQDKMLPVIGAITGRQFDVPTPEQRKNEADQARTFYVLMAALDTESGERAKQNAEPLPTGSMSERFEQIRARSAGE